MAGWALKELPDIGVGCRILVGISNGVVGTSIFTVEVCSPDMRGPLSALESVLRCAGSVLVLSLGLSLRWWQIASFASLLPLLGLAVCWAVPESPVFRHRAPTSRQPGQAGSSAQPCLDVECAGW